MGARTSNTWRRVHCLVIAVLVAAERGCRTRSNDPHSSARSLVVVAATFQRRAPVTPATGRTATVGASRHGSSPAAENGLWTDHLPWRRSPVLRVCEKSHNCLVYRPMYVQYETVRTVLPGKVLPY